MSEDIIEDMDIESNEVEGKVEVLWPFEIQPEDMRWNKAWNKLSHDAYRLGQLTKFANRPFTVILEFGEKEPSKAKATVKEFEAEMGEV